MPTKTKQAPREPIEILATVNYDLDASTAYAEVYRALSDSDGVSLHKVVYLPRTGRWSCTCRGASQGHVCRHQRRAQRKRRIRFYSALWAGQPASVLRRHLAHYQERVASSNANEDDWAALDHLTARLENLEAA